MYTWIICGFAVVLRLVLINQSLWLDEAIEGLALMGRQGPLMTYALGDYQPPLYHFIGYITTHLLGYSEIVLRLPSLLSGVVTVYFVMKIAELLGSRKTSLIAGLLVATNPLLIYYSQEGRTYAMTTFFVTASFYYFLRLLQHTSTRSYLLYALFTILFLWTSYLSWFVLLAQGGYAIWRRRFDIFKIQIVSAATLLGWLPSFIASLGIGQATRTLSPEWGQVVGGLSWKSLPLTWVKFAIGRIGFDNKLLYALIVGGIGIVHLVILRRVSYAKYIPLLVWILVPITLGLLTAFVLPVYSYFRVLFVLPAYLLLLSVGLSQSKTMRLPILLIATQLIALTYFWFSPRYHKEDWRTLALTLSSDPTASVAMPSRAQSAPLLYYNIPQSIIEPSREAIVGERVYYIRYVEDLFDTQKVGQANLLSSGYTSTKQTSYPGIQVEVYENSH